MPIDFEQLSNWKFPEERYSFSKRDTLIYALGIGLGVPATDPDQLRFVFEEKLRAVPTMAVILGYRGFWMKELATGIDWRKVLHGQQRIELRRELPIEGVVTSRQRVTALIDKGRDKGAILVTQRDVFDADSGILIASIEQTNMLRADGGFGQSFGQARQLERVPEGAPDVVVDLPVIEQAALLYRLSGDYNPLHADPEVAKAAGFSRPILHGLCTFGIVGHAVLRACAHYEPSKIRSLEGRFTAPAYPGETIRIEIWHRRPLAKIRARSVERDVVLFDYGQAEII